MKTAYIFKKGEKEVISVITGSKAFVMETIYDCLDNGDDYAASLEKGDLYETTDTNFIAE